MGEQAREQGGAIATRGRKSVHWRRDPVILGRLPEIERRHIEGQPNTHIAAALGLAEATIREDLKRLKELWAERVQGSQAELRQAQIARLEHVRTAALKAAKFDEMAERAVLFGEDAADFEDFADGQPDDGDLKPERPRLRVRRDAKGAAQFRGNKSAALNVARQATMDQAKLMGVVVDKVAPTDADGNTLTFAELMQLARKAAAGGDGDA
jgi:hypothetical protein